MTKNKTYVLGMFPYPSGEGLHVGHVRIFTACDVMARYFRMTGQGVLSPMGWDAFGLPAENAAIKNKTIPQQIVPRNYANFKKQMQNLSLSFDWEHELATTDPSYYAITQWIFLQLYKKGLVYREQVPINWCPKCLTGLANEEVLGDGTHERCGSVTGKKLLPQWVMKITDYAERLLADLDKEKLDWPRGILEMQKNWIGKKEGINIRYKILDSRFKNDEITVFTTTPVNFGATFLVVAPEHDVIKKVMNGEYDIDPKIVESVKDYYQRTQKKSEIDRMVEGKEKTGVFTGLYVTNHVTEEKLPVWTSDFALAHVGTGALQGCPGHDMRDFEFAQKFGIDIKRVVVGEDGDLSEINTPTQVIEKGMTGKMINSDFLNGVDFAQAMYKTMDYFEEKGWGTRTTTYHLRDWVFSRQRYWGEPIPLVYCEKCANDKDLRFTIYENDGKKYAIVPLSETSLPLTLPTLESYEPTETGESPLSRVSEWVSTKCPECGGEAKRETDTMPNWAGSCWYFLAYPWWKGEETKNLLSEYQNKSKKPISDFWQEIAKPEIDKWLPVDWYLGGAEHAVLHLLYARFWVKVLNDLGLVDFTEPFLRLRSVGLVLAEDGKKMSKSLGNVVNPDDMIAKYGSDATRMYEMFMGPWDQSIAWDSGAINGQVRFLGRVRDIVKVNENRIAKDGNITTPSLASKLKKLVEKVERGVLEQKFNTAIAGIMEFVNAWKVEGIVLSKEHLGMFFSMLSLFAPDIANELGEKDLLWPDVSEIKDAVDQSVTIAVQVNGKLRGTIVVDVQSSVVKDRVVEVALADPKIKKWIEEEPKKVIFVPGKLVNLVG